jgi:molybdopterin converting factor small subunit
MSHDVERFGVVHDGFDAYGSGDEAAQAERILRGGGVVGIDAETEEPDNASNVGSVASSSSSSSSAALEADEEVEDDDDKILLTEQEEQFLRTIEEKLVRLRHQLEILGEFHVEQVESFQGKTETVLWQKEDCDMSRKHVEIIETLVDRYNAERDQLLESARVRGQGRPERIDTDLIRQTVRMRIQKLKELKEKLQLKDEIGDGSAGAVVSEHKLFFRKMQRREKDLLDRTDELCRKDELAQAAWEKQLYDVEKRMKQLRDDENSILTAALL